MHRNHRKGVATALVTGTGGGLLSGVLGGGGGAVMIPLMTGVMKMRQHVAHGTSLVIITFAALGGAITYSLQDHVDFQLVAILIAGSAVGAYVGARASTLLPGLRLRQVLGLFLIVVALRLLVIRSVEPLFSVTGGPEALIGGVIGLVGGLASGALGVGGGSIFVPALVLLLGVGQHEAQGISIWVIVVSSAIGAVVHYRQGTVDMAAARWIVPAAVPAGVVGSLVATLLNARQLQLLFAVILVCLGLQMLLTATRRLRQDNKQAILATEIEPA
ncbi:MAG: sulfite exporter TauE/SafE family protein [Tepidiformaceae bacterium]